MKHIWKLGRTCKNCSDAGTENGQCFCKYSQSIFGHDTIQNPRKRAKKCPLFQNKKLNSGEWKNEEVFYKNPQIFNKRKEALFRCRGIVLKSCATCACYQENGSCYYSDRLASPTWHCERYEEKSHE